MTDGVRQDDSPALRESISRHAHRKLAGPVSVIDNTERYTDIQPGMVLRLEAGDYYIFGDAKEGRFGIDDQPKLWVKYGLDLADGSRKIIKLVFHEQFSTKVGPFTVSCQRDPEKESRVLRLVAGDPRFMHGRTVYDRLGNNIRIIDLIRGKSLYNLLVVSEESHEQYFHQTMPAILQRVVGCLEALAYLHQNGEQHGDVRNDHILIDADTGEYRWIDFDYRANYQDYDVWAVGNLLTYVVGQGTYTCRDAERAHGPGGTCIAPTDRLLFHRQRLANLQKMFPYVPDRLNRVIMRFSEGTEMFYEDMGQIITDLREAMTDLSR